MESDRSPEKCRRAPYRVPDRGAVARAFSRARRPAPRAVAPAMSWLVDPWRLLRRQYRAFEPLQAVDQQPGAADVTHRASVAEPQRERRAGSQDQGRYPDSSNHRHSALELLQVRVNRRHRRLHALALHRAAQLQQPAAPSELVGARDHGGALSNSRSLASSVSVVANRLRCTRSLPSTTRVAPNASSRNAHMISAATSTRWVSQNTKISARPPNSRPMPPANSAINDHSTSPSRPSSPSCSSVKISSSRVCTISTAVTTS